MTKTRNGILEERRRLKAQYGALFDSMAALLYRHDPIGINFDFYDNKDEKIASEVWQLWQGHLAHRSNSL